MDQPSTSSGLGPSPECQNSPAKVMPLIIHLPCFSLIWIPKQFACCWCRLPSDHQSLAKNIWLSTHEIEQKQKTILLKSFFVLSEFTPEEMKIKPHQVSEFNPNLLEQKQNNKSFPLLLFSPIFYLLFTAFLLH